MKRSIYIIAVAALLAAACNKGVETGGSGNEQEQVVPRVDYCNAPLYEDENGNVVPMKPAEIPEEILAQVAAGMTKVDDGTYTIPVVFHIFGASQGSGPLTFERMERVLTWINNDFNMRINSGDPENFNTINEERKQYSAPLKIELVLGKFHPDGTRLIKGQTINGGELLGNGSVVLYDANHPVAKKGPGNYTTNSEIRKIAWSAKSYVNVYICRAIFGNGDTSQSGLAYYPDNTMTLQNTARIAYNGGFLPGGSYWSPDFTSVITHEFGHFFNLAHTFADNIECGSQAGYAGDNIDDTPECQMPNQGTGFYWGHNYKNCHGEFIDHGNFMNYGVYCHFTIDQVARMEAALAINARNTLYTESNLKLVMKGEDIPHSNPSTIDNKLNYMEREIIGLQ